MRPESCSASDNASFGERLDVIFGETFVCSSLCTQHVFDKPNDDAADQRAWFDQQLAQAKLDASQQRAEFDSQLAKAALDNADQKAQFENEMAKATLDACHMQVRMHGRMGAFIHAGAVDLCTSHCILLVHAGYH